MFGRKAGSDGANAPSREHPGNISDKKFAEMEARAEVRSAEETAKWTATQQAAYEKRAQN